jgi:plastocyanin
MSTTGVDDDEAALDQAADRARRHPLGLAVTAIWAVFAIAAPAVIVYRQAEDDNGVAKGKAGGDTVTMEQIAFKPDTLTVAKGTVVSFVNEDLAPHTVTQQGGGSIDSGVLNPGKTFTLTIDDTFEYICAIHPSMKAKVILSG